MDSINLGGTDLRVSRVGLGTMTFGEQVGRDDAFAILDRALERGVTLVDTAEMYPVAARRETCGATEAILGEWFAARPGVRERIVLATKVAGPGRNLDWIRGGRDNLTAADILQACDDSLRRLGTDRIDLYQIHWPNRNVPLFGEPYFDPTRDTEVTSIEEQLDAMARLVAAGKVRHIGLSNETPWGVAEFVHQAERLGLPRIVSVQNPYALVNRAVDNGLDEVLYRTQVALLAYSPLGFGLLTGKYDDDGVDAAPAERGRLARFEVFRKGRWGRRDAQLAARRYAAIAREHGMPPTRMALAFCYGNWRVASTLVGVTSLEQLDENLDAWGTTLSPQALQAIDAVRREIRDPAQ
jgi:aryl-alcohol dehydrogenase-like predicted oxidoreductase